MSEKLTVRLATRCELLEKRVVIIRSLLKTLRTIPPTETILLDALDSPIRDYEDAVVEVSGMKEEVDYIVSRDLQDFKQSRVPALTAADYLAGTGIDPVARSGTG